MLNIIGHKSIPTQSEIIPEKCSYCGTEYSVKVSVFQKYVFWFWIPFLPAGKTGISECEICKKVWSEKEMPENMLSVYYSLKFNARIPIWMFSGAFLFILILGYWQLQDREKNKNNAHLVDTPAIGDVLEVKNTNQQYTLTKVIDIKKDSIFLVSSNYQSNEESGLAALKDSSYSDEISYISKTDLKALFNKGDILHVNRN
jgi:hypothetical protein